MFLVHLMGTELVQIFDLFEIMRYAIAGSRLVGLVILDSITFF